MDVEGLKIDRKELRVDARYPDIASVEVPIYPRFLDDDIELNPRLANEAFPESIDWFWEDINEYHASLDDGSDEKEWVYRVFLSDGKPEVERNEWEQGIYNWRDNVIAMDNGFANSISINRNHGGTLFLEPSRSEDIIGPPWINFSEEKLEAYSTDRFKDSFLGYRYHMHNVDHAPGALFLRNWAVMYLNKALEELAETGQL